MQEELKELIEKFSEFYDFLKKAESSWKTLRAIGSWVKRKWPGDVPEPIEIEHSFWQIDFFDALGPHVCSRQMKISGHETYIAKMSDNPLAEINPEDKFEFNLDFNEDTGKLRGAWVEGDGPKAQVFFIEATLSNSLDASGTWWLATANTSGTWKGLNFVGHIVKGMD